MTTKEKILHTIEKIPNLTNLGISTPQHYKGLTKEERNIKFEKYQEDLINNIKEFEKTCKWLHKVEVSKNINHKRSSYNIKHIAEKEIGYISNGTFIAAAVYNGFNFKIPKESPNVLFNMSEKSLFSLSHP